MGYNFAKCKLQRISFTNMLGAMHASHMINILQQDRLPKPSGEKSTWESNSKLVQIHRPMNVDMEF